MEFDRSRFVDRELLDPARVMEGAASSGAGMAQSHVGQHADGNLDFLTVSFYTKVYLTFVVWAPVRRTKFPSRNILMLVCGYSARTKVQRITTLSIS